MAGARNGPLRVQQGGASRMPLKAEEAVRATEMELTTSCHEASPGGGEVRGQEKLLKTSCLGQKKKVDFVLFAYFALWYLGNYYYNITNKWALGGSSTIDLDAGGL